MNAVALVLIPIALVGVLLAYGWVEDLWALRRPAEAATWPKPQQPMLTTKQALPLTIDQSTQSFIRRLERQIRTLEAELDVRPPALAVVRAVRDAGGETTMTDARERTGLPQSSFSWEVTQATIVFAMLEQGHDADGTEVLRMTHQPTKQLVQSTW